MKIGTGYAHGKIILIGEHAVVYGTKAIALPFLKTKCEVRVSSQKEDLIETFNYIGNLEDAPTEYKAIVCLIIELKEKLNLPPLKYEISSNIPISSGMGSSAAIAGGIVEAVYDYIGLDLSSEERFELTQFSEKIAHGNPSGIDALATSSSNAWLFQKGVKPIPFDPKINAYLIVGQSGRLGNTIEAVNLVRKQINEEDKYYIIEAIGENVIKAYSSYLDRDVNLLGQTMTNTQDLLRNLNLSTKAIDDMVQDALDLGAVGAKLTGGGMGGCVIALAMSERVAKDIQNKWKGYSNLDSWILNLNEDV